MTDHLPDLSLASGVAEVLQSLNDPARHTTCERGAKNSKVIDLGRAGIFLSSKAPLLPVFPEEAGGASFFALGMLMDKSLLGKKDTRLKNSQQGIQMGLFVILGEVKSS